jgi:ATP-dependent DNA helicase RecG
MRTGKDLLEQTLAIIKKSLDSGQFYDVENELVELKGLSTKGDWKSLRETVAAFLNTQGGYVICGISERNKQYIFSGFDRNNEGNLMELQTKFFRNDRDQLLDLTENILLEYQTLDDTPKTIAIIRIIPLSEDKKYLKLDGIYYERILTGDKEISPEKLRLHQEYKTDLIHAKEIQPVIAAKLDDLDIDKINDYIVLIRKTSISETLKSDLQKATDFLYRRHCINNQGQITLLGLLLFGKDPAQYLENRAEVDCYLDMGSGGLIGRDKRYFRNDVITLSNNAFNFVWGHIKIGRSYVGGGSSVPEYPEELIREVINNALAHRDYTINEFITIKVNQGKNMMVTNPGTFKQKMLILNESIADRPIRRIIPGIPETKNPKLAAILKTFEKIESQGVGMATLVNDCLANLIDVPYYDLQRPDTISLVIPSGELLDAKTQMWLNSFRAYINQKLSNNTLPAHETILAYLYKSEQLNQQRYYTILLSHSNNHFDALRDLEKAQLISKHPKASTEQVPIYIIDPELLLTEFNAAIEALTGIKLAGLDNVAQKTLNIIYRHQHYNHKSIRPNQITAELYHQLYDKTIDPKKYETLGRKIRKICANLLTEGVLQQDHSRAYSLKPPHVVKLPPLFP